MATTKKAKKPAKLPKSDGDAGVADYIASMEPWQRALGQRVDEMVMELVPEVRKAVKWRCPFYGLEGQGWFLAFNAFQYHVKFTFFKGTSLTPEPPKGEGKEGRSIDVREKDVLDEAQMASWIRQAAAIPGWGGK